MSTVLVSGHDGEVWMVVDDNQSFKKRIKAVPAILSRRVDAKEEVIDLSVRMGQRSDQWTPFT